MRILILLALISGCSFKQPETVVAGESLNARPAKSPYFATISTAEGIQWERNLLLSNGEYRSLEPVTLPATVPESLQIVIRLQKFDSPIVQIDSSFTHIDQRKVGLISQNLGERTISDSFSEMTLQISGLRAVFNDNTPDTGSLIINLISEAGTIYKIILVVRTPPLNIEVSKQEDITAGTLRVQNGMDDYELVYSFKVSNPNTHSVEFSIPKDFKGKLHTVWRHIHHINDECFFHWYDVSTELTYSEEFTVLRLNSEIQSDLFNPNENIIQVLSSNEEIKLGIFTKTPKAAELLKNAGEPLYYEIFEPVVVGCNRDTGKPVQVIIQGSNHQVRYPVYFTPGSEPKYFGTRYADTSFRADPILRQRLPLMENLKIFKGWPTLE
ncbi:MAG: hypothetical protein KA715_00170 [Xanthomonadaceae bacterium]|nr:hypothetical protein [Xanthomonadaceae bacterium]